MHSLHPAEHGEGVHKRDGQRAPQRGAEGGEPGELNEGAAEERDEQAVAAGGVDGEDATTQAAAGRDELLDRHGHEQQSDAREEGGGLRGPGHPGEIHMACSLAQTRPSAKPLAM